MNDKGIWRSSYNTNLGITKKEFSTRKFKTFLDKYYAAQYENNQRNSKLKERKPSNGEKQIIKNGDLIV